jgi:hypothetical protein
MANMFDQFNPEQPEEKQNIFDQLGQEPTAVQSTNIFDQFSPQTLVLSQVEEVQPTKEITFGSDITKEEILSNPSYMSIIEQDLMLRQGGAGLVSKAGRGLKQLTGGVSTQMYGDMTPEEKFEVWQENQRSLAGGQTVTLGNELALVADLDDGGKSNLRDSYRLFESMGNIFTGRGTWSETFDGVGDYLEAAIWDPTTVLGLGVGRAYTAAGSKAAAVALKESVSRGVNLATKEALKSIPKGVSREAAEKTAKAAAEALGKQAFKDGMQAIGKQAAKKQGFAITGSEFVTSVGKDILYQSGVLMPTETTKTYSYGQTALAGIGAVALPALIYGAKGVASGVESLASGISKKYGLTNQFQTYKDIATDAAKLTKDEITQKVKDRLDIGILNSKFADSFEKFNANKDNMPSWVEAKQKATKWLEEGGVDLVATKHTQDFYRRFILGSVSEKGEQVGDGLAGALYQAGFVYVPRDAEDTITNFYGDAILWLDPKIVKEAVEGYEAAAGTKLGIGYTPELVSSVFKEQESLAGQYSNIMSIATRKYGKGVSLKDLEDIATKIVNGKEVAEPAPLAYTQATWKRLLTAHPATTAVNLIGFGNMSLMNGMADIVHAGLSGGVGVLSKATGIGDSTKFFRQAKGSLLGSTRRGFNLLRWDDTIKEAENFFELRPDVAKELFSVVSGDSGLRDAREFFKIGTDKWYVNALEGYTQGMQKISGVMLQDEITKLWGFMGNFDQAITREYGTSYADFMKNPDWIVEMATDRFNNKVLGPAMERTQKETGSLTWSDKVGKSPALLVAKEVEKLSNSTIFGWTIPFGRWFNTSTAFISDYTGASFLYNSAMKAAKVKGSQDKELLEYVAKAATGWGLVAAMYPEARDRVDDGDPWNIRILSDGTREDITNKFPENLTSYTAQVMAHLWKDGEIPEDLAWTGVQTFFTNTFRSSSDAVQAFTDSVNQVFEGNYIDGIAGLIGQGASNIVSGFTRPLDPINKAVMLYTGDVENPDRRQGSKFLNQSIRYVDQILNWSDIPERKQPTTGGSTRVDIAKTFSGIGTQTATSLADKMFASIGSEAWKEIKWQGDPMVKNRMDDIISTLINNRARETLSKYPDFFDMPLDSRMRITKPMVETARKDAKAIFESGVSAQDQALVALSRLNQFTDKRALDWAKSTLEIDDLAELVAEPGGAEKLKTLLDYATAYRDRLIQ